MSEHSHTEKKLQPRGACAACDVARDAPRHNHPTRDIKALGICPACDAYHRRNP